MPLQNHDNRLFCCGIGGMALEIRGEPGLDQLLTGFRRQMADFRHAGGGIDLTLKIMLSDAVSESGPRSSAGQAMADAWMDLILKKATSIQRRLWTKQTPGRLKALLTQPALTPVLELFLRKPGRPGCVPLEGGALLFDLGRNDWILLLAEPPVAGEPGDERLWPIQVNITIVNAVMCLLSLSLAAAGGVVAHAVGLNRQGRGYVFAASSGGGKTSLSMQSPPGAVLADDGVVIRRRQEGYMIYPTPFRQRPGGDTSQWAWHQQPVPLTGLYLLERSPKTCLAPVSRVEAIDRLLRASTHFFPYMDPESAASVFDFWRELVRRCPVAWLHWRKGDDFFKMLGN